MGLGALRRVAGRGLPFSSYNKPDHHQQHRPWDAHTYVYRERDLPRIWLARPFCSAWSVRMESSLSTILYSCCNLHTHKRTKTIYIKIKSKVSGGDTQAKCITYDSCRTKSRRDNFFCTPSLRTVSDKSAGNYRAKKYIHLAFIHSLTQTPHTHNIHTILTCS